MNKYRNSKRLGDLCRINTQTYSLSSNWDDFYYLDTGNITENAISEIQHIIIANGDVLPSRARRLVKRGDIIFSTVRPNQRHYGYINEVRNHFVVSTGFCVLSPKENIDGKYIYYFLTQTDVIDNLQAIAEQSTSTYPSIRAEDIANLQINIPSLEEQQKISSVLSSLDDKIEVNNQINRNLEEQAKTIFKSWFVDFEPFGGNVPDDWKKGTIADLGKVIGGGTPSKAKDEYYSPNGIPWITPKDLSINKSKFISRGQIDISIDGLKNSSATIMPKGTVLFSSRAPIGYIAIAKNEVTTNQGFKSVVPHPNVGTPFVYMFLKHNLDKIESVASGSTFKEVSGGVMKSIPALIPDNKSLSEFSEQCLPLFQKQEALEEENNVLQETRDTLLPKLISGDYNKYSEVHNG